MARTIEIMQHENVPWCTRFNFRYDGQVVELLREIPGAIWDKAQKSWVVPVDAVLDILNKLVELGYELHIQESLISRIRRGDYKPEDYTLESNDN